MFFSNLGKKLSAREVATARKCGMSKKLASDAREPYNLHRELTPRLEHNSAYDHKQEIGVIDVASIGIIRRWHLRDQVPLREIARRLGISRNTFKRYIRAESIEPTYADRRPRSSLDKYTLKLSAWLKTEAAKSRKQRRTLKQLHLELRALG